MKEQNHFSLTLLFLIFFSHKVFTQEYDECGKNIHTDPSNLRVITVDDDDEIGTWPWMVSAGRMMAGKWFHKCGGSVISTRHVLTAAHCTISDDLLLKFGDKDLADDADDVFASVVRSIKKTFRHPKYNLRRKSFYYDIAIWEVSPITYSAYLRPICLPNFPSEFTEKYSGDLVTLTGWGQMGGTVEANDVLKKAPIRIYDSRYCNETHDVEETSEQYNAIEQALPDLFESNLLCAGYERGGGSCFGDSGSPIVKFDEVSGDQPHYVQLGVVSGGIGECGNPKYPAVYVRVDDSDVFEFIQTVLKGHALPEIETDTESTAPTKLDSKDTEELLSKGKNYIETFIKRLLKDPNYRINSHIPDKNQSLFTLAASVGNIEAMTELLSKGADPNLKDLNTRKTALHHACLKKDIDTLTFLAKLTNIEIDSRDSKGRTPLAECAVSNFCNGVKALEDRGANLNAQDSHGNTPLMESLLNNNLDCSEFLIRSGADVNKRNFVGRNTLHFAVMKVTSIDMIKKLIELGVEYDLKDQDGRTPFFLACRHGNLPVVKYLFKNEYGTRSDSDHFGVTPMNAAASFNHVDVLEFLLSKEGDFGESIFGSRYFIDTPDNKGRTPLFNAAAKGFEEVVILLLDHDASTRKESDTGKTPEEIARENGHINVANRLAGETSPSIFDIYS